MTDLDHAYNTLSQSELTTFETDDVAYVKTVMIDGKVLYAVFNAEGQSLTVFDTRDLAFATIRQNDMEPISTH